MFLNQVVILQVQKKKKQKNIKYVKGRGYTFKGGNFV